MDHSTPRLPGSGAGAPNGERRRRVRQKLHTPVYASFNGPHAGMVVDLSELLDLHEEGFAVQTSERLEMNRAVSVCLDLPETKNFIHGSGQVIWSDDAGRGGIRFSELPESSQQALKEWLFANLLIACSNHAARTEQLAVRQHDDARHGAVDDGRGEERIAEAGPLSEDRRVVPISSRSANLASVEAVRRETRESAGDIDAMLQLITEYALNLTGASGAALALLTGDQMICRARSGEPSPPLGAPVDTRHGISGECVRSGLLVSCADTTSDLRVDSEVCRSLGLGSLMAAPIVSDFRVVGLLEIFSPYARRFTKAHETVLYQLVEMIPKIQGDRTQRERADVEKYQTTGPDTVSAESQLPARELNLTEAGSVAPFSAGFDSTHPSSANLDLTNSDSTDSGSTNSGSLDAGSIEAIREVLRQHMPEVFEQVPAPEQVAAERVPEPVPEAAPAAPSRLLYRALLGLAIAVVAMVLGYLVGPLMEKRWADASPTSEQPLAGTVKAVEAASRIGGENVPDRGSSTQRLQAKSLADLQSLADEGGPDAQWEMGVRYHNGEDVPRDDAQAMRWFQRAGEQGNLSAQVALGAYYWAGRGVRQDLPKAYFWSAIALAQGDENSKARLEGLASQMTRAQVAAARQQAEVWIRQHNSAKSASN
ncbi:MAG: GAF domain-containing protein [Terriglobales bacterium]